MATAVMFERSEDDKIEMKNLTVRLGAEDYTIPVLRIGRVKEWRAKAETAFAPVLAVFDGETSAETMQQGLMAGLRQMPDTICMLVFAYCPELPEQKILDEATEEQMAIAFARIWVVAFPFLAHLGLVREALRTTR